MKKTKFLLALAATVLFLPSKQLSYAFAATPTIQDFGSLTAIESAAISPSGKRFAMISSVGGVRALRIFENGKIVKAIAVVDEKIRSIAWASESLVMMTLSRTEKLSDDFTTNKAEMSRTLFIDLTGKPTEVLFAKKKGIAPINAGFFGIREIQGKRYGYFGGIAMTAQDNATSITSYSFEGGNPALYRVDFFDFSSTKVSSEADGSDWRDWQLDAQGQVAAILTVKENGTWRLSNGKAGLLATGKQLYGGVELEGLTKGSQAVIYSEANSTTGEYRYFEVPLSGGPAKPFLPNVAFTSLFKNHLSGEVIGYKSQSGAYVYFDESLNARRKKIRSAFSKLHHQIIDYDDKFEKFIVNTSGSDDSGTYWEVDTNAMKASPLGFERSNIYPEDVGAISVFEYTATDGTKLDGILTLPPGKVGKNLPLVMLPHGGPHAHDEPVFDWWAQAFASQGYAVFQPNFRGSTNRDSAFVAAGYGEWGKKMQTDISDGLTALAANGIVDSKRVCIVGASYGGYAALAGVTLQQGLYRCSVAVAGVSDLQMMINSDIQVSGGNNMLTRALKRQIGSGRDIKEVSPRKFAAKADAPILLIHGKDDTVVPIAQSKVMADALKDAKKPFEMVVLEGEDHYLSRGETRLKMLRSAVEFVKKHNP